MLPSVGRMSSSPVANRFRRLALCPHRDLDSDALLFTRRSLYLTSPRTRKTAPPLSRVIAERNQP
jgi:hypothetical protein